MSVRHGPMVVLSKVCTRARLEETLSAASAATTGSGATPPQTAIPPGTRGYLTYGRYEDTHEP
eukprot:2927026-Prymnesium_polylepis.2